MKAKEQQIVREQVDAELEKLRAQVQLLRAALRINVRRCDCGEIGVWEWFDEDGEESCCEAHKERHLHKYGPVRLEASDIAIKALSAPAPEAK